MKYAEQRCGCGGTLRAEALEELAARGSLQLTPIKPSEAEDDERVLSIIAAELYRAHRNAIIRGADDQVAAKLANPPELAFLSPARARAYDDLAKQVLPFIKRTGVLTRNKALEDAALICDRHGAGAVFAARDIRALIEKAGE